MPSVQKNGRDSFLAIPPSKLRRSLRERQLPCAAPVRRGVKFPRTWCDGQSVGFDLGKASACDPPIGRAIRQPQNAPIVGDIEITADRIKRDARGRKVWESWPS